MVEFNFTTITLNHIDIVDSFMQLSSRPLHCCSLCKCRAINGVKDMVGFRQTFNLSYDQGGNGSELLCDDDVGSSAILVSLMNK